MTAIMIITNSNGYTLLNTAPIIGILLIPGIVIRDDTDRTNLLLVSFHKAVFSLLVKNSVSAIARMFTTTPLMT